LTVIDNLLDGLYIADFIIQNAVEH